MRASPGEAVCMRREEKGGSCEKYHEYRVVGLQVTLNATD